MERIRDGCRSRKQQRIRLVDRHAEPDFRHGVFDAGGRGRARVIGALDLCADRNRFADFLGRADGIFLVYSADRHGAGLGSAGAQPDAGRTLVAGIILAVICSVVIGMVDNFLRPLYHQRARRDEHAAGFHRRAGRNRSIGLLGVVLGPIVIATAATLLDVYVPVCAC